MSKKPIGNLGYTCQRPNPMPPERIAIKPIRSKRFFESSWKTILAFAMTGLMVACLFLAMRSRAQLRQWQAAQESIAKSDLNAILAVLKSLPNSVAQSKSGNALVFSNSVAQVAVDSLKKGELVWADATDSTADPKSSESEFQWSVEPNQYLRLRTVVPLRLNDSEKRGQSAEDNLTLVRRFASKEVDGTSGSDWMLAFFIATLLLGVGCFISWAGFRRTNLLAGLTDWSFQSVKQLEQPQLELSSYGIELEAPDVFQVVNSVAAAAKQRLLEIQQSADQSSRVMSAMPVGVVAFDQHLKLLFANRAGRELLDLSEASEFGQSLIEVIRFPPIFSLIQNAATEQQTQETELEMPMGKVTLRLRAHPLIESSDSLTKKSTADPNAQAGSGVLLTVTDETRLKLLENARRDFTANVSHELKTPLSAIKAYAETLLMGALDDSDASRRFVERISEQANRLDVLIRDLLHLTKLQSQPVKPPLKSLKIEDVLKTCVEEHRTIGGAKNITIDVSQVDRDCKVNADLESLRTVLGNLLGNAVRYNRPGGWVQVSTRIEQDTVVLCVKDNGIGIPPEDLDRIFERFYRVEKARSQDAGGTGLGLAIVKHLVQAMSADIQVRSELGTGSEFELRLQASL